MHKLLKADLLLVLLTSFGLLYLYYTHKVTIGYAILILIIYILSKVIGYLILPYKKFNIFLNFLINSSKFNFGSGFEIFKVTLVMLLYIGFIFIDPSIWIIESILVIAMRVWSYTFFINQQN